MPLPVHCHLNKTLILGGGEGWKKMCTKFTRTFVVSIKDEKKRGAIYRFWQSLLFYYACFQADPEFIKAKEGILEGESIELKKLHIFTFDEGEGSSSYVFFLLLTSALKWHWLTTLC